MSPSDHQSAVHHHVLPNGLTALLCETHLAPVVEVQIWAKVGSADERPGEAGLAHFHEHMLFKGTERRGVGDVAAEVEGAGGRINAYTSFDVTVYHATLPSDQLALGLDVLSDAVLHSSFVPDEIDREIEVVLEEIRRAADSPGSVLGEAVFAEAYRVHPYRAPILGTHESVSTFDRERVRAFFERWYTPDNLVVVVTGDFEAEALLEDIRETFGGLAPGSAEQRREAEPRQDGFRSVVLPRHFERAHLELVWPTVSLAHGDGVHLDLLSHVLGGCESSRLVRRVKERDRVADRIDAYSYTPLDAGLSSVSIGTDPERALAAVEAAVREVERMRVEPVSSEELERARVNFLASEQFERESVTGLAQKLGGFHVTTGDWRREQVYLDAVRTATAADLQRVAVEYLAPERLTVGCVVNEGGAGGLDDDALAAAARRGVERTTRLFARPAALAPAAPPYPLHSFELPCGAALHVVERRNVPVVAARAAFLGGLLAEDEEHAGLSQFTSSMWLRGTRGHSAAGFARAGEDVAAEVDSFCGRSSLGMTLEAPTEGLDRALELFASALLEPAFDPEELEHERRDTLAAIERREDRLAQRAFMLFLEAHFREHPYRHTLLGDADSVARFDRAGVLAHHEWLVCASRASIAIAGDVDPEQIATRLATLLADLGGGERPAPSPPAEAAPREIRSAELRKDREQAHVVVGFRGLTLDDDDRFALEVVSQLLAGQGGRLFLELRDRKSLAYAVSAVNVEGVAPGWFACYIATAPDKLDTAKAGLLQELEGVLQSPPGDVELDRARRYLVGNHAIDQQRDAAHAAQVSLNALYGLGPAAEITYPERILGVTKDDVLRVARRTIDLDAYTLAVVRP